MFAKTFHKAHSWKFMFAKCKYFENFPTRESFCSRKFLHLKYMHKFFFNFKNRLYYRLVTSKSINSITHSAAKSINSITHSVSTSMVWIKPKSMLFCIGGKFWFTLYKYSHWSVIHKSVQIKLVSPTHIGQSHSRSLQSHGLLQQQLVSPTHIGQ